MNKIKWNIKEETDFLANTKTVIICNECGWLMRNPSEKEIKCENCGLTFEQTKTAIENVKGE